MVNLNAAHADVQGEKNDGEFKQPFPKVTRLKSLLPVMQEGVDGRIFRVENFAARGFGNAPEQIMVRLGSGELWRIIDAGADDL